MLLQDQVPQVLVQPVQGVQFQFLARAQAHLFGQGHHQVAVEPFGQLLSQRLAQDLRRAD